MRISRKKRPDKPLIPFYRRNEKITSPEVRVLDREGKHLGVMKIEDALRIASEGELDLVEIDPVSNPPVCKLIEFSQFKYQKEKELRKQRANTHIADLKGIRLSIRISEHDLEIRKNQAAAFLERGDKVRIEIILRGRERGRADLGVEVIKKFIDLLTLTYPLRFEQAIERQGTKVTAIVTRK